MVSASEKKAGGRQTTPGTFAPKRRCVGTGSLATGTGSLDCCGLGVAFGLLFEGLFGILKVDVVWALESFSDYRFQGLWDRAGGAAGPTFGGSEAPKCREP